MKISTLSNIFLLASLLLLSPITENPDDFTLDPLTLNTVGIEVHQPSITITATISGTLTFNVTYYDVSDDSTTQIVTNQILDSSKLSTEIDTENPGYYIFHLYSSSLGTISIKGNGIYTNSWLIIIVFTLFRLGIWVKQQYF